MSTSAQPLNAKIFAQPRLVRVMSAAGVVICSAACLLALSLPLLMPEHDHRLLIVFSLVFSGYFLYLSLVTLRRSADTVACTADGLCWRSAKGSSVFIAWDEIGRVEVQNVMQRLVVTDRGETRRIILEYHLQDFGDLRRLVMANQQSSMDKE